MKSVENMKYNSNAFALYILRSPRATLKYCTIANIIAKLACPILPKGAKQTENRKPIRDTSY
jgi:hypothetical protein